MLDLNKKLSRQGDIFSFLNDIGFKNLMRFCCEKMFRKSYKNIFSGSCNLYQIENRNSSSKHSFKLALHEM
jgi:hypothetical protein